MYHIAIIGVGSLGKRHLESVLKSKMPFTVYVLDNNENAVNEAVALSEGKARGVKDIHLLPKRLDIVIIATSSVVRRTVFEQLIQWSTVKNIIFEKVLFQRVEDYFEVERKLEVHRIHAWVNCARREYASYKYVKGIVDECQHFSFQMTGGEWGLGCNGIHMLDLVEYLSGSDKCEIKNVNLLPVIEESKRKGYKEIFGSISGICGKCESFSISCFKESSLPMQIALSGNNFRCVISEGQKKMVIMRQEDDWKMEEKEFQIYYQSQLTQGVVERIITDGKCMLPEYKPAMRLHLAYIEPLISFFESQGLEKGICPIT